MKTFDVVAQIGDDKTKSFAISNANRDDEAARATSAPVEVVAPNFDDAAFNAQLENAYRSHVEAHLPKPEAVDVTLRETLKAAFQSGNTVGSALSSQSLLERAFPTSGSNELTDDQILDRVGKAGMMPLLPRFVGVTNEAQFEARKNDLEREQKNLQILEASGVSGVVASLVAGVIDLPTLIPVGRALQLGRKGASLAENVGKTAVAGTVDAAASEAGLQATQQLRGGEDAAVSIASGAILGGALGVAIHKLVGADVADRVTGNLDRYREDAANGFTKARESSASLDAEFASANSGSSAGAAFSEIAADAAKLGREQDAKVSAMLLDKIPSITAAPAEYLGKILGGKTLLGRPRDAFRTSNLDTVRTFQRMFYSSPEISEANAAGKLNFKGMTVEDHIGEDLGKLAEFKAEVENVYAANKTRFKSVDDLAERAYYAALNEGVDKAHADPAVEAVARAFNKYTDYQHAKHVANGRLPENTPSMGTKGGYVHRVYNQTALRNDEDRAREMLLAWARRKVTADVEEVLSETNYTELLRAHEEAVAAYPERVAKHKDFQRELSEWKQRRDMAAKQDRVDYEADMAAWRDKVAAFLSDPANDGKKHPYGLQKPKLKDYNTDVGPRPRQGPVPTITDGNPKPATPKNKYGVPMLRENISEYARELADDVYNTLAGVKSAIPRAASGRVKARTGYLKGRVVDIPDDALAESFFLETNLLKHAEHMHYTSGRDASLGSVFKMTDERGNLVGDYDGNSIIVAAEEEANAVINETTGEAKTALILERDRMLQGMRNEIDIARGAFDGGGSGLIGPKAAHVLASTSYAVRLGGVTVSSLTDAPKIAIANGLGNTFAYGVMPMIRDFRAAVGKNSLLKAQGIRTGNVVEVLHNTRMSDVFELNNPHAVGDRWTNFVDKATKYATQLSLIARWTDFTKQIVHNVTSSRLLSYADMGFDRLSQKNKAWIANLGLDADDLAKIKSEYGQQDLKHVAGILYADLDKWADQDLAARFAAAFRREGRNTVVSPGLGDRPQIMHTVDGKLMYQFQTFMLSDQVRFVARQAQLANIAGDASEKMRQRVAFGAALASLTLSAVFVDSLKRALRDNDADWEAFSQRWSDNPAGSMYDAIDRAGFMGSLFGASNTVGKFSNGQFSIRGGAQWLAGDVDRGEARKTRDIGVGGVLFGPTAGLLEDTVKVGQAAARVAGGGTLSRADIRRFQNVLPYHSVPGIQQGLNALNDLSAGALGLPPEPKHLGH